MSNSRTVGGPKTAVLTPPKQPATATVQKQLPPPPVETPLVDPALANSSLPLALDIEKKIGEAKHPRPAGHVSGALGFEERQTVDLMPSQAPAVQRVLNGSPGEPPPGKLVIFGATGDLAAAGLVRDALLALATGDDALAPDKNPVVLIGRDPISIDDHLQRMADGRKTGPTAAAATMEKVKALVASGLTQDGKLASFDLGDPATAKAQIDALVGDGSAVAYAAIPPAYFDDFMASLKAAGFEKPRADGTYRRLVLEKPLGVSPADGERLAKYIAENFQPGQVLLIDHFLPLLNNALAMRTNATFDEALSAKHATGVTVFMDEQIASNDRPYFRDTGLLLDVVQNHVMVMLSTIAADLPKPEAFTADGIRSARADVLTNLKIDPSSIRRGQFDDFNDPSAGAPIDRTTGQVKPSSAETFVGFDFAVDTPRWKGVDFSLRASKGVAEDRWGAEVELRSLPQALATKLGVAASTQATVTVLIFPEQEISIRLRDGRTFQLPVDPEIGKSSPYERLIVDALQGDAALFVSPEEPLAAWRNVVAPVQKAWAEQGTGQLVGYARGTSPADI